MQTAALADKSVVVAYGRDGFDAEALMAAVDALDLSHCIGFAYGSGFECQPQLLAALSEKLPLIGNSPDVVAAVKHPATFFAALTRLGIRHPDVCHALPQQYPYDYLIKSGGGCGGTHIRTASQLHPVLATADYYQRKIDGHSISLLFLANPHGVEAIGFNEQWSSPAAHAPYRYGGAVSNPALVPGVRQQLIDAAQMLAREFGLTGLNSIDAIVATADADSAAATDSPLYVLEINPRLSATVGLYTMDLHTEDLPAVDLHTVDIHTVDIHTDAARNLFELHVQACRNPHSQSERNLQQPDRQCNAHAIVYAAVALECAAAVPWPDWVTDMPACHEQAMIIPAGEPVCTVLASAADSEVAKKLAQGRVETMQSLLQLLNRAVGANAYRGTSALGL